MKRWLLVVIALALVAGAVYALLSAGPDEPQPTPTRSGAPSTPVAGPRDQIDEESRNALREILREADREEEQPR